MRQPDTKTKPSLMRRLAGEVPARFDPKKAFLEELEMLLNARYPANAIPAQYHYASESILAFGLPDSTETTLVSGQAKKALALSIRDTLRIFEPRLSGVRVNVEDSTGRGSVTVFSIEALLRLNAGSEPISVEITKQTSDSKFAIRNRN